VRNRREIVRLMGAASAAFAATSLRDAHAQDDTKTYPNRVVRLIVGFAAGGGNDVFARLVGQKLSELIGQSVVIENRPGAGGRLAAAYVAAQPADGYTLLVGAAGAMSVAPAIYPHLPCHPLRSFVPLTLIGSFPLVLTVAPSRGFKSVTDLVTWAKANPDKTNYATSAPGFTIATELLKLKTGMPGVAIPYKSSNEMVLSVISGQTLLTIADPPPTVPLVKGGQLRALAVTGAKRLAELPDVPSMAEAGLPDVNIGLWSGLFAPAGTPPAITQKLETELRRAIQSPQVADKLRALGVDPGGISSDELRSLIEADIKLTAEVVKAANLTFEE
jgi:tripartite-type tricarboxylate transporter receptor subunit TctC